MPFTIDFTDDAVLEWHATDAGTEIHEVTGYTPTIYALAETERLDDLEATLATRCDVASTARERWRPAFRRDPETVLRIDVSSVERVRPLAGWIRRRDRPGTYRLFNVDFSREFRYCLERGLDPVPDRPLRTLDLSSADPGQPAAPLTRLEIDGEPVDDAPASLLATLQNRLDTADPDILVLSTAELVPALFETADQVDEPFHLGRRPGYEQLAARSTYESYGQVGHSPARYNVPGRAIIDRSNTFFFRETNLDGCLDLVERSRKPLQELSWVSIGNVLTAIQIRKALERNVLVPWKSWRHEFPKTMAQLHEADRGGFTFAPDVGVTRTSTNSTSRRCIPTSSVRATSAPRRFAVTVTTVRTSRNSGTASVTNPGICRTFSSRLSTAGTQSRQKSRRPTTPTGWPRSRGGQRR